MTGDREREDVNGHLIDQDGKLLYDHRCYFCLNSEGRQFTYVKVEIDAEGES